MASTRAVGFHRNGRHPVRVDAAFRQTLAMRLRIKGYSYLEIGKRVCPTSVNPAAVAYKMVGEGVKSVRLDSAEQMRDIELTRLDALQTLAWLAIEKAAKRGNTQAVATGVNSVVRISDRRAKLMGLDAPVKYDLLMHEARKMAESLDMPENEFLKLCEQTATEAWGSTK